MDENENPDGAVLSREEINELILKAEPPLVENARDLEQQLQPNGFDLTLDTVEIFTKEGFIGRESADVPPTQPVRFDRDGWMKIQKGEYLITFEQTVNLPKNLMALGRPRSSLLRSGASIHMGVWDAGYRGKSKALLTVHNQDGIQIQRGAKVIQMVFIKMSQATEQGYQGTYQGEGLESPGNSQDGRMIKAHPGYNPDHQGHSHPHNR